MPPSKLDRYLNILEVLVDYPEKPEQLARKAHIEPRSLERYLEFLTSNGVVEERRVSRKLVVYAITERGLSVYKTLRTLKYLEKLRDSLPIVEEAREIAALFSKRSRDLKEE